jgi:hypothetical protein
MITLCRIGVDSSYLKIILLITGLLTDLIPRGNNLFN